MYCKNTHKGIQQWIINQRRANGWKKMSHLKSESAGNLLIRNIQCFKLGNTEKIWLWLDSRLQRKERWLKEVLLRFFFFFFFCSLCHHLGNCSVATLLSCARAKCTKMSYLIWFSQAELVSWQAPRRGLNKREIRFNSCHFGGLQSSQGSCRALKAVVTLREAGSWGCRMGGGRGGVSSANRHLMCLWGYGVRRESTC